jgi:hypothetical protein
MKILFQLWLRQWRQTGNVISTHYAVAIIMHLVFCVLNFKWTFDLFASKIRAWNLGKEAKIEKGL